MKSVAKELFTNRYWMKVEERAFYSDEWIEEIGIMGVTTMEEAEDHLDKLRQVKVTIPMIAEYYRQGYAMAFVDPKDIAVVFDLIDTHLDNWVSITNTLGFVSPMPPIEDFECFDALAELLFPYRKVNTQLNDILQLFMKPTSASSELSFQQGLYTPRAPLLYKYCQQVYD